MQEKSLQEQRAEKFAIAMDNKPVEEQLSVYLISKNVLNGCSWEFIRNNPEVRRNLDAFKSSKVCNVQEVTYNNKDKVSGYLISMQMSYLCNLLSPKNDGPLEMRDLELAQKHRKEALASLATKMDTKYKGVIGIYCTNDSQTITIDGKTFPAYAVTLKELCTICNSKKYGIYIGGQVRYPNEVLQREDAVIKALTVAPSSNALLIRIAPVA